MSKDTSLLVHLKGGIGNQLFQYAFAKSLSQKLSINLFADDSYYAKDSYGFQSVISRLDPELKKSDLSNHTGPNSFILSEGQIHNLDQIQQLFPELTSLILDGYWQGEAYFDQAVGLEMLNKLQKSSQEKINHELINRIRNTANSVAVHIRRKDYGHMGLCKTSYYAAAINHVKLNHPDAELFVFSDEPNFTVHLMQQNDWSHTFVTNGNDLDDLYLMSLCKHFVISNSSYSWWAAWFGEHCSSSKDAIVIAPKEWVTINNTPSPCPPRWIQVPDSVEKFQLNTSEIESLSIRIQKTRFDEAIKQWFSKQGDQTLRVQFDNITKNSLVLDLGGYEGDWTDEISHRYDPTVMIFEPMKEFFEKIQKRFISNPKIIPFQFGLGSQNQFIELRQSANASGAFATGESHQVQILNAMEFLQKNNINKIDLLKINIEGGEYDLLDHLIFSGDINKVQRLQVQFHDFVPNAVTRRAQITQALARTHVKNWDFYFVWEEWSKQ